MCSRCRGGAVGADGEGGGGIGKNFGQRGMQYHVGRFGSFVGVRQ
jgi:hypothetical protein